ncbi:MAG: hypothetical protein V1849_00225 [Chloroflexota bacterium]
MPKKNRKSRVKYGARPARQAEPGGKPRSSPAPAKPGSELTRRHQYVLSDLRRSTVIASFLFLCLIALYFFLR